ncbi:MAG TPA: hypothetical protein VF177_05365 [Anaerolineae bacterium]
MLLFLIIKLLVVVVFLLVFLRRPSVVWGVGLMTVTTAVLLDTFLGTFNREELLAELGFFFYVISGALLGGAAIWLWGLLRPLLREPVAATIATRAPSPQVPPRSSSPVTAAANSTQGSAAFDRQMLYDEIRHRFSRDDILDLIFDLGFNENDVMTLHQDMNQLIVNIMDLAAERGQTGALALAVERILTPIPPENLPRLEKINLDSPPTILRHYLLAYTDLAQLDRITAGLGIDGEQLGVSNKKEKVRNLLLHLYRRNRIEELIDLLHADGGVTTVSQAEDYTESED